jgi:hypothetical protein
MVCLAQATPVAKTCDAGGGALRVVTEGVARDGLLGESRPSGCPCECRRLQHLHYFRIARLGLNSALRPKTLHLSLTVKHILYSSVRASIGDIRAAR